MKRSIFLIGLLLCSVLLMTGCETLKGIKQDAKNFWNNLPSFGEKIEKFDNKIRENLW